MIFHDIGYAERQYGGLTSMPTASLTSQHHENKIGRPGSCRALTIVSVTKGVGVHPFGGPCNGTLDNLLSPNLDSVGMVDIRCNIILITETNTVPRDPTPNAEGYVANISAGAKRPSRAKRARDASLTITYPRASTKLPKRSLHLSSTTSHQWQPQQPPRH
jgi:hypothetical protein